MSALKAAGKAITKAQWGRSKLSGPHLASVALDAVSDAGFCIVELPRPDTICQWGWVGNSTPLGTLQARPDGSIELRDDHERTYTASEFKAAAFAMLAAADAAERFAEGGFVEPGQHEQTAEEEEGGWRIKCQCGAVSDLCPTNFDAWSAPLVHCETAQTTT